MNHLNLATSALVERSLLTLYQCDLVLVTRDRTHDLSDYSDAMQVLVVALGLTLAWLLALGLYVPHTAPVRLVIQIIRYLQHLGIAI